MGNASVAQLAEQEILKFLVAGSIPAGSAQQLSARAARNTSSSLECVYRCVDSTDL